MNRPIVVNLKKGPYDVYIGRGSIWGNPFVIGKDGDRKEVLEKYEEYINHQPELLSQLSLLKNKRLGCYCHPLPCHGDILVQLVVDMNNLEPGSFGGFIGVD